MADYSQLKVPDLKKLLQERGLAISGNKADLVGRLQDNDKKSGAGAAGEDEIDWDEDDNKATTAPAAAATAAAGQGSGQVANPTAVASQEGDAEPAKTADSKPTGGAEGVPAAADEALAASGATKSVSASEPEAPKQDFSIGISKTDAEKEAEKRAARAKRFGVTEDDEAKKLAERAKKFGVQTKEEVVKGLDSALPEHKKKRGREDRQGGRAAKRQTPDRRTEAPPRSKTDGAPPKRPAGRIIDDPVEKAKAEARAKRFQAAT